MSFCCRGPPPFPERGGGGRVLGFVGKDLSFRTETDEVVALLGGGGPGSSGWLELFFAARSARAYPYSSSSSSSKQQEAEEEEQQQEEEEQQLASKPDSHKASWKTASKTAAT